MYARALDHSAARIRELRRQARDDAAAAAVALAFAAMATQLAPSLALPALAGGLVMLVLAARALLRRSDLLARLAADPDAQAIREVAERGARAAAMENRRSLAAAIRSLPAAPGVALCERVLDCRQELELLADELERGELSLDPVDAARCEQLLSDGRESPLFNPALPAEALHLRLRQIRAGLRPRHR